MKIRRFVAKDMRTALAEIKEELGVDAVIMSNKKIPEGVELMAAVDYNQSVPVAKFADKSMQNANRSASSVSERIEASDDVVSLGQSGSVNTVSGQQHTTNQDYNSVPTTANMNQSASEHVPADSLSALLGRQVQQPAQHTSQPQSAQQSSEQYYSSSQATQQQQAQSPVNLDEVTIEQQLRDFTDRLSQPNADMSQQPSQSSYTDNIIDNDSDNITANVKLHNSATNYNAQHSNKTNDSQVSSQEFTKMQQEMASIRSLLEHQVSGLMWQDMAQKDPQRAVLVNRLLALGLNDQIADQIAGYVPEQSHESEAWSQATQLIAKQINTTQNDIINRGGVVALVGPTGVGKTTTIAKLAAGFAQVHGNDQVALISTDTFRIAGFEQLATYGKIIGCQVSLAKDSQALDTLLQQYAKKKLILIDTAGMGQRDMRLAEHLTALISNSRVRIRNYLVIAANSQQRVMQENVDRFKKVPLSGCIYTKLDESISIGEIITTSIQNGLPIGYLTDGQRVPEDIKVANAEKLVTLADKMATKSVNNNVSAFRPMPIAPAAIA
ncbi:flagellar biosynthesis protein FlhF [Colwellia echini]|uniref:Flagellar biosynthesis protein FlhF n=1 Tax=Colwellia echini TaxID=1982103 RepID=A0ABY3MWP0_9GAMM|nr:flagellar biosynthesis protein FlhF [Colwellia echini]TYK65623.1 flagellar biosynthesis protein FlhF [Colwellia echini]